MGAERQVRKDFAVGEMQHDHLVVIGFGRGGREHRAVGREVDRPEVLQRGEILERDRIGRVGGDRRTAQQGGQQPLHAAADAEASLGFFHLEPSLADKLERQRPLC